MSYDFGPRGIGNASSASLTEWLLVCAAAVETILVAVLALIVAGVSEGSGAVAALARCNALLLAPLRFLPASLSAAVRQGTAVAVYGFVFLALIGTSSWFERQRALS